MRTADEVRHIINRAITWDRAEDAGSPVSRFVAFDGTDDGQFITAEELALVDWRLPIALRDIVRMLEEKNTVGIHASWATESLQHWEKPMLKVMKSDGTECLVSRVNNINRHPAFPERGLYWTVVKANHKTVEIETAGEHKELTYIYYTVPEVICVANEWMDENFPGWNDRMTLMEAVGSTPSELVTAILSSPAQQPSAVLMSEVNFG